MATGKATEIEESEPKHSKFQVEQAGIICRAHATPTGEMYLRFEGQFLPSLPNVYFGLNLTPDTTKDQADALAAQITEHCPVMFGQFMIDGDVDGLPLHEIDPRTGLAKLD
jgi:hypothetical protein